MKAMTKLTPLVAALLLPNISFGQAPETNGTPATVRQTPAMTAKPGQARLSAADEAKLKAAIAQHQRVRSQLPAEHQAELDQLAVLVKRQLFAAQPQGDLLASATQIVSKSIPGLTRPEATSLAEYALGAIASGGGAVGAASTKSMQETQMSFNLQYLMLQSQMQNENRSYTMISNIMKTKHDTVKNSISNIR